LRGDLQCGTVALTRLRRFSGAAAAAEPVTVVALGDSLTAGYGLPDGEGLVPQLQGGCRRQRAAVVVQNAGVSGDTTAGGVARLDWALGPEAEALIVELGGNDMLRGLSPAEVRANLIAILQGGAAGACRSFWSDEGAGELGAGLQGGVRCDLSRSAAEYGALLAENFFHGLIAAGGDPADGPQARDGDRLDAGGRHPPEQCPKGCQG
jgi:acyl-CoA thioesterase-1